MYHTEESAETSCKVSADFRAEPFDQTSNRRVDAPVHEGASEEAIFRVPHRCGAFQIQQLQRMFEALSSCFSDLVRRMSELVIHMLELFPAEVLRGARSTFTMHQSDGPSCLAR